jgi:hypothetical protein
MGPDPGRAAFGLRRPGPRGGCKAGMPVSSKIRPALSPEFLPLRDGLWRDLMPVGGKENGKLFSAATPRPSCCFQFDIHESDDSMSVIY